MPRGDVESLVAEAMAHVGARCPRVAPHPAAETVAVEARAWAQRTGLHAAADGGEVDRTRPVAPVAEVMRDAPVGVLRIGALFATWLAVLADRAETAGWDADYSASLVSVLEDGCTTGADALHFALTDIHERIVAADGAALLPELADALARHTAAACREQQWLSADTPPGLAEFLDNRADRTTVPTLTVLHRLDPALGGPGGPGGPGGREAEGVPPLGELAALLNGVDEDLAGYPHAVETGRRLSLVAVLMREYGHSVPTAFQSATVLFGAWRTQLDHGVRELIRNPGVAPSAMRQAEAAADWVGALHRRNAARHTAAAASHVTARSVPVG
ncbi:terpene synthase family protein [Yinghuangia sp. YIM S09857]|uniref:terpene synthase family protein n=1 Tax=Yinghuangia sp. YIM S09857 TaxID=3436929 RepID=UPI003F53AE61